MKECFGARAGAGIAPTVPFGYPLGSEDVLVSHEPRKSAFETRPARRGLASFRSALTAFVVALSLVVQLIAMPYSQALAGPAMAGSNTAAIAADLKAVFGDAAGFCAHIGDKGVPSPQAPCNHCDDQCPLCRSVAEAAPFVAPDVPTLPVRPNAASYAIGAAADFGAFSACPAQRNRARAPPLAV
jgi:hypothetical protein